VNGLQIAWFVITAAVVAAYAILDGFDLGIGILYRVMGRNGTEREALHSTVSPVWDAIRVGGLLFAIFPPVYATVLGGFYIVIILTLFGLIARAAALGLYYSGVPDSRGWTAAFSGGSLLAAFLLGLVAGNLIKGVPLSAGGEFAGNLGSLFNPFAIAVAVLTVTMFANQGATWAALKTHGSAYERSAATRWTAGWVLLGVWAGVTLLAVFSAESHVEDLMGRPLGWVVIGVAVAGIACQQIAARLMKDRAAFVGASAAAAGIVGIGAVGMFPALVRAANDPSLSLTVENASAPRNSLIVMAVVAAIGIPLVAVCAFVVYRAFRGRAGKSSEGY
jgi:cytochrome bd ubiquinol oxidase subunit II